MNSKTSDEYSNAFPAIYELAIHESPDYQATKNRPTTGNVNHLKKLVRLSISHMAQYIDISEDETFQALCAAYDDLVRNNYLQAPWRLSGLRELPGSPWFIYKSFEEYLHFCNDFVMRQRSAIDLGMPPVFIVSHPKTASSFIASVVAQGLNVPVSAVSFSHRQIVLPWMRCFLRGGAVTHDHLWPSVLNKEILSFYKPKIVIIYRNPKQVVVSNVFHTNKYIDQLNGNQMGDFLKKFYKASPVERFDLAIDLSIPKLMVWMLKWYEVYQGRLIDIEFLSYESFVSDKSAFFDKLAHIFNLPVQAGKSLQKKQQELENQTGMYNMRKKAVDEWREILSPEQQKRIDKMVPMELKPLFEMSEKHAKS